MNIEIHCSQFRLYNKAPGKAPDVEMVPSRSMTSNHVRGTSGTRILIEHAIIDSNSVLGLSCHCN